MNLIKLIQNSISVGTERTIKAKKNILLSFLNKGVAIIVSLLIVSTTIDYLDAANYGIWITISSIVGWAGYFDLGLGHGFRNRFAIARAKGNDQLAKEYVSTTYFAIALIFVMLFIVFSLINNDLSWDNILNVKVSNALLQRTFVCLIGFFSLQSILNVISTLLSADQKPAIASIIYTVGQIFALIGIVLLTKCGNGDSSILSLSYILSGIPCVVYLVISVILYATQYRDVAPTVSSIKLNLLKDILSLGGKFFLIQLSMLFIFQCTNIIITRNLGPEYATEYNVAYRYFNVIFMLASLVLSPFWSAFTDAFEKKDYQWMNSVYKKLSKLWWWACLGIIIMVVLSKWVYRIWLGGNI